MDHPDHALAARRYAEEASDRPGVDPRVTASLSQTEALLAVAAAIDRLASALSQPGPRAQPAGPARPSADADAGIPANPIEAARKKYPNAYRPWTAEADEALIAAHRAGHDVTTLADTFGRQPSAIQSRLNRLGLNPPQRNPPAPES